jgi:Tol biopolymer transport system component
VPATGGDPVRVRTIFPRSDFETPRGGWSPDWSFQVLIRGNGLYRVPTEGEPTLLAELAEWDPDEIAFSPDGRYVAVIGWEQPASQPRELIIDPAEQVRQFRPSDIYIVPVQGGAMRRITAAAERTQKSGLRWHPDGQRLAYVAQTEENVVGTRMVWLDGRPTTPFFDEPGVWELGGRWAPDGETYYFLGHDPQNGEGTYRRNPDGTVELLWVSGELNPFGRFLGADGRTLLYTAWKRTDELWMIEGFR